MLKMGQMTMLVERLDQIFLCFAGHRQKTLSVVTCRAVPFGTLLFRHDVFTATSFVVTASSAVSPLSSELVYEAASRA